MGNVFPRDCIECPYMQTCQRYYGARGCKFEREIVEIRLERKKQHEEKID